MMSMELQLTTLRGTLFLPRVQMYNEVIDLLKTRFPNASNSYFLAPPQVVDGVIIKTASQDWMLSNNDENENIVFSDGKIDFFKSLNSTNIIDDINAFASKCGMVYTDIMKVTNSHSNRMAIAPSLKLLGDENKKRLFCKSVFSKNEFQQTPIESVSFSGVFRNKDILGQREILINHLSKFHVGASFVQLGALPQIIEEFILEFDINTAIPTPVLNIEQYSFTSEEVEEFYSKAQRYCSSLIEFYLA